MSLSFDSLIFIGRIITRLILIQRNIVCSEMRELYSYNQLCNSTVDFSPVTGASSESSSPRSSTTDDDLLEIHRSSEAGACNTAKPIYNFSIPDFIKHERQPVSAAIETSIADEPVIVSTRPRDVKRRFVSLLSFE